MAAAVLGVEGTNLKMGKTKMFNQMGTPEGSRVCVIIPCHLTSGQGRLHSAHLTDEKTEAQNQPLGVLVPHSALWALGAKFRWSLEKDFS